MLLSLSLSPLLKLLFSSGLFQQDEQWGHLHDCAFSWNLFICLCLFGVIRNMTTHVPIKGGTLPWMCISVHLDQIYLLCVFFRQIPQMRKLGIFLQLLVCCIVSDSECLPDERNCVSAIKILWHRCSTFLFVDKSWVKNVYAPTITAIVVL